MTSAFRASRFSAVRDVPEAQFQETEQVSDGLAIGQIIRRANNLSIEQIESILAYQQENGVLFGEAAVALGLANTDDVQWALAQQFHYPYATGSNSTLDAELVVATKPFSDQAEAFRTIRSHLIMKVYGETRPRPALAVLSPDSGDGKTFFAANLAVAFSQLPGRTLLIDGDLRSPRQHDLFKLANRGNGLSTILSGRGASKVIQSIKELPNLYVLPAGPIPPNPLELLERSTLGLLMRELKTKFDRIIVDTAAAQFGTDGAVIASKCGAGMIVARRNQSKVNALQNLVHTVNMGATQLVGTILNEI